MKGADEYCKIFKKPEQIGKLFLVPGSHARGATFHIWILPTKDKIKDGKMPWSVDDSVEVYGITGGQPGWTETYGWLHTGQWVKDFEIALEKRKKEIKANKERVSKRIEQEKESSEIRRDVLLSNY